MVKNVVLSLVSVLLIPLAMVVDLQLKLLNKYTIASFDPWPYWSLMPLAHLVFAVLILLVIHRVSYLSKQNFVFGIVFLIVGLFFTIYWLIVIVTRLNYFRFGWGEYGDLTQMVGVFLAASGIFALVNGRRMIKSSDLVKAN